MDELFVIEGLEETAGELGMQDFTGQDLVVITIELIEEQETIELWAWLDEGSDENPMPALMWREEDWETYIVAAIRADDKKRRGRSEKMAHYAIIDTAISESKF